MRGVSQKALLHELWAFVTRAAEAENAGKDGRKEDQADAEAGALAKGVRQLDRALDGPVDVEDRDQQEKHLSAGAADDLILHPRIVDGDQNGPAGLVGLCEDPPLRCNQDDRQNEIEYDQKRRGRIVSVIGIAIIHFVLPLCCHETLGKLRSNTRLKAGDRADFQNAKLLYTINAGIAMVYFRQERVPAAAAVSGRRFV